MTPDTRVDQAIERIDAERSWTDEKRRQFDEFVDAVEDVAPANSTGGAGNVGAAAAGVSPNPPGALSPSATDAAAGASGEPAGSPAASASGGAGTAAVLEAFDEHLTEYSGAPGSTPTSVHECVAEEFSTDLAVALCGGNTAGALTPGLKAAVLEEAGARRAELDLMATALERERTSLCDAREALDPIVGWFREHNPTPLSELGFEELRRWHQRVGEHRSALDSVARARQDHVRATTAAGAAVGVEHAALVEYLYVDFDPTHPVLATVATLAGCCRRARRAIRDHLVRRV